MTQQYQFTGITIAVLDRVIGEGICTITNIDNPSPMVLTLDFADDIHEDVDGLMSEYGFIKLDV